MSSVGLSTLIMTDVIENMEIFRVRITAAEEQFSMPSVVRNKNVERF